MSSKSRKKKNRSKNVEEFLKILISWKKQSNFRHYAFIRTMVLLTNTSTSTIYNNKCAIQIKIIIKEHCYIHENTLTTTHQLPIESKNIKENRITVMEISNSKIINSSHVHYWIVLYT